MCSSHKSKGVETFHRVPSTFAGIFYIASPTVLNWRGSSGGWGACRLSRWHAAFSSSLAFGSWLRKYLPPKFSYSLLLHCWFVFCQSFPSACHKVFNFWNKRVGSLQSSHILTQFARNFEAVSLQMRFPGHGSTSIFGQAVSFSTSARPVGRLGF